MTSSPSFAKEDWTLLDFFFALEGTKETHPNATSVSQHASLPHDPSRRRRAWKCLEVVREEEDKWLKQEGAVSIASSTWWTSYSSRETHYAERSCPHQERDYGCPSSLQGGPETTTSRGRSQRRCRVHPPRLSPTRRTPAYKLSALDGLEMAAYHVLPGEEMRAASLSRDGVPSSAAYRPPSSSKERGTDENRFVEVWIHGGRRRRRPPVRVSRRPASPSTGVGEEGLGSTLVSIPPLGQLSSSGVEVSSTLLRVRMPTCRHLFLSYKEKEPCFGAVYSPEEDTPISDPKRRRKEEKDRVVWDAPTALEREGEEVAEGEEGRESALLSSTPSPSRVLEHQTRMAKQRGRGRSFRDEGRRDAAATYRVIYPPLGALSSFMEKEKRVAGTARESPHAVMPLTVEGREGSLVASTIVGPALYDHVMFQRGPLLLLHGGRDPAGYVQSALHAYHCQRHCWISPAPEQFGGVCPPRMCGHGVCPLDAKGSCFVLIGVVYDALGHPIQRVSPPSRWEWQEPWETSRTGKGGGGSMASRHTGNVSGGRVWEGRGGQGHRNEGEGMLSVYVLDLSAKDWSEVPLAYTTAEEEDEEEKKRYRSGSHTNVADTAKTHGRHGRGWDGGRSAPTPGPRSHFSLRTPGTTSRAETFSSSRFPRLPLAGSEGYLGHPTLKGEEVEREPKERERRGMGEEEEGRERMAARRQRCVFLVGGDRCGIPLLDAWVLDLITGRWREIDLTPPLHSFLHPSLRPFITGVANQEAEVGEGKGQAEGGIHPANSHLLLGRGGGDGVPHRVGEIHEEGREGKREVEGVETARRGGKTPRERRWDRVCPFRLYPVHALGHRAAEGEARDSYGTPPPEWKASGGSTEDDRTAGVVRMTPGRMVPELEILVFSCLQSPPFRLLPSSAQVPYRTTMPLLQLDGATHRCRSSFSTPFPWDSHAKGLNAPPHPIAVVEERAPPASGSPFLSGDELASCTALPLEQGATSSSAMTLTTVPLHQHPAPSPPPFSSAASARTRPQHEGIMTTTALPSSVREQDSPLFLDGSFGGIPYLQANGGFPWLFVYDAHEEGGVYAAITRNGSIYVTTSTT